MFAVRDGAEAVIDIFDQFQKVERELAVGFDRADVVRAEITLTGASRVEAVPT